MSHDHESIVSIDSLNPYSDSGIDADMSMDDSGDLLFNK